MDLRPSHLARRFVALGPKFVTVSLIGTVITQSLIWLFHGHLGWNGGVANFVAVCIDIPPTYALNRRWVWGRRGTSSFTREVAPFWIMTFLGLGLSTLLAAIADAIWHSTLAVSAGNIAGFGILYVAKFVLLDQYLFHTTEGEPA